MGAYSTLLGTAAVAQTLVMRDADVAKMVDAVDSERLKEYVYTLADFGTRHSLSEREEGRGIDASQDYVKGFFDALPAAKDGRLDVVLDRFTVPADGRRIPQDVELANIMATLKGSDPQDDRVFIVSAHIDSRALNVMDRSGEAPGANDDGSGVAGVMEMARVMSERSFPATIIFLIVTGEEQGLKGAEHMAKRAKAEEWNLVAMLNNDMIGNSRSSGTELADNTRVRIFSEGIPVAETERGAAIRRYTNAENDSPSRQLARYMKEVGERYVDQLEVKLIYRSDRFLRGGDQTPFAREGFTAIRVCEMNENYYYQHEDVRVEDGIQYGDLPEFVDYAYMQKVTALNVANLAALATAPSAPRQVGIDVRRLSNSTTLQWEAPETGEAVGYYVLMRETDQSMWEKKFFTTETRMELPYSKDNYFFAVQAVGERGFESLPVFPQPIMR
ncbi:MAG: M28 family metallopeptidase [Nitritalea sp.]